jgi:hypothetical protein
VRRAAALALALALAACAGDDDGGSSDAVDPTTTTATTAAPATTTTTTPVGERYPEHAGDLYAGTTNWICHPELDADVCDDTSATVVGPDGTIEPAAEQAGSAPPFDCFYAYPTTSLDPDLNSDLVADASETDTVRAQFGRFTTVCRTFAPVYRSITLNGLGRGGFDDDAREIAYGDVVDAWKTYVDELGEGRPVVIVGHSQGAGHLRRLLEEEIRPNPDVDGLLVSAVLLGTSVTDEQPCTSADEFGCVISYSSYPADQPPVEGAIFGRDGALCVDPNALLGEDDVADVTLPTTATLLGAVEAFAEAATPFVLLPDALRLECTTSGTYSYLAVSTPGTEDTRPVERLLEQRLGPTWGLHLFDAQFAQDELLEVLARQAEALAG